MVIPRLQTISDTSCSSTTEQGVAVHPFDARVAERWDRFVSGHSDGTHCHLTAWKRVIEKTFGFQSCYAYAERAGEITGVVPLFLVSNWVIGECLHSVPYGVYGGICAADEKSRDVLISHVKQLAVAKNVGHLELHQRRGELFPDFHSNTLYTTFTTQLSGDPESNLKKLPRDTRYMIRKSEKTGLRVRHGVEQLKDFYALFCESMRRLGTPVFPRLLFENLFHEFGSCIDLMMVYSGERPITGVLSLFHRDAILPYYAGASPDAPAMAANNFMYWQLMKFAAESGFRTFDFGRSKRNTGAYQFKSQWGMTAEVLNYQVYLVRRKTAPNFSPVNPKFEMAGQVWRKLPLELTKRLGPRIVRWFP